MNTPILVEQSPEELFDYVCTEYLDWENELHDYWTLEETAIDADLQALINLTKLNVLSENLYSV